MRPKLSLKAIFDERGRDRHTDIILHQYMRRQSRELPGSGNYLGLQLLRRTSSSPWTVAAPLPPPPPLQHVIDTPSEHAKAIRLYDIYPELYVRPMDKRRVYRFVMTCFDMGSRTAKLAGSGNYLVQQLLRRTPPPPPPPPPPQPARAANSVVVYPQSALHTIQNTVHGLPKHGAGLYMQRVANAKRVALTPVDSQNVAKSSLESLAQPVLDRLVRYLRWDSLRLLSTVNKHFNQPLPEKYPAVFLRKGLQRLPAPHLRGLKQEDGPQSISSIETRKPAFTRFKCTSTLRFSQPLPTKPGYTTYILSYTFGQCISGACECFLMAPQPVRPANSMATERPALLRSIANKIKLHEIYPELYIQPLDERRLYRFVDGLLRYAQQNREDAWLRQLPPAARVQTKIVLTVDWDTGAPVAAPAPPPPPSRPACPTNAVMWCPETDLKPIQDAVDSVPKQITETVKKELDAGWLAIA
ncbi:hypothetical protein FN846DRAFT_889995 [Sphaerosporella brunnea]|uniref:F-box domain-containing protein n=1 Tax=Sphaerosporella brunnea TaxID=1250544 RepID=A0A5J5EXV4_9PEZI|nr:hypothetical protein FN846DRAFT_889995 [Sphaerosporella brunnea]